MNDASDAYATLGVPRTASASEIKRAFGTLSRHVHPDKSDNKEIAESAFREVRSAYDVLSDPMQRHIYDEHGWIGLRAFKDMSSHRSENSRTYPLALSFARPESISRQVSKKLMDEMQRDMEKMFKTSTELRCSADASQLVLAIHRYLISDPASRNRPAVKPESGSAVDGKAAEAPAPSWRRLIPFSTDAVVSHDSTFRLSDTASFSVGGELKSFRTLKRMKNKQAALVNSSLFSMRLHFRHSAHHFSTLWKWAHGLNLGPQIGCSSSVSGSIDPLTLLTIESSLNASLAPSLHLSIARQLPYNIRGTVAGGWTGAAWSYSASIQHEYYKPNSRKGDGASHSSNQKPAHVTSATVRFNDIDDEDLSLLSVLPSIEAEHSAQVASDSNMFISPRLSAIDGFSLSLGAVFRPSSHINTTFSVRASLRRGVNVELGLQCGRSKYKFPVHLGPLTSTAAVIGVVLPLTLFLAGRRAYHYLTRRFQLSQMYEDSTDAGRNVLDALHTARQQQKLLATMAAASYDKEMEANGLIIIEAWFGLVESAGDDAHFTSRLDVTAPLRALVRDSSLCVDSWLPMLGVCDPLPHEAPDKKRLSVHFAYRGVEHRQMFEIGSPVRLGLHL